MKLKIIEKIYLKLKEFSESKPFILGLALVVCSMVGFFNMFKSMYPSKALQTHYEIQKLSETIKKNDLEVSFELKPLRIEEKIVKDAWGNPLYIQKTSENKIQVLSCGEDGVLNGLKHDLIVNIQI